MPNFAPSTHMTPTLLIGSGRMAYHLGHAMVRAGWPLVGVAARNTAALNDLARFLDRPALDLAKPLPEVGLVVLAVSDDAIAEVAGALPDTNAVVAHTAGAMDLEVLAPHAHRGVLWPIQSLSHGAPADFGDVPMVVEGSDGGARDTLLALARKLSSSVMELGIDQRRRVHLAAVVAANFPVFLLGEARRLLREAKLPPDLLMPLWRGTAARAAAIGPEQALTGPARRGDRQSIESHLALLEGDPDLRRTYALLSARILEAHGHDSSGLE